ncbi:MAG: 3-phosphoshikimate 1-carboxyvinyltransferase [Lentisphaeria bacterium]
MDIKLEPALLTGSVLAPPSKSAAHRLLIAAALADKPTELILPVESEDTRATRECLQALGAIFSRKENILQIIPLAGGDSLADLDCGESGSTLRFLLPLAATLERPVLFRGRGRLPERPLSPFREELQTHGCQFSAEKLPFTLSGSLQPGNFSLPGNISSQFISGLLFALPRLPGDSTITLTTALESSGYVDLTLEILQQFRIAIAQEGQQFRIPGGQKYRSPGKISVEGDWSNAAFFLAAGALSASVDCRGLKADSRQGDRRMLQELRRFGAVLEQQGDTVLVMPGHLTACDIDMGEIPDLLPILALVASLAKGSSVLYNAARLRLKESDRLTAVKNMLLALGGKADETSDSLIVHGQEQLQGGTVDSFNDHRIVMAAAIAACRCRKPVCIRNAQAVQKSYPDFFSVYSILGGKNSDGI